MAHLTPQTGYAPVNGLQLYYELHGTGTGAPLAVLHGAFMTIELLGNLVPGLARTRPVIAVELQGHGHTAEIERPLTYEQLADDIAALLCYLRIGSADLYGYSLGGGVALQVALRHPQLVRTLVLVSSSYTSDGMYPEVRAAIEQITPDLFAGTPWRAAYDRTAPHPEAFPTLVAKLTALDRTPFAWPAAAIAALSAPTLIIIGDSDGTRPEQAESTSCRSRTGSRWRRTPCSPGTTGDGCPGGRPGIPWASQRHKLVGKAARVDHRDHHQGEQRAAEHAADPFMCSPA